MKFTIEGFSQKRAIELGLDAKDLVLLRWLVDWYVAGSMETLMFDDEAYFWLSYNKVILELPILGIGDPVAMGRRFKRIVLSGLLKRKLLPKKTGTRIFYKFDADLLHSLISSSQSPLASKIKRDLLQKSSGSCSKNQVHIDSSTNDYSIKDSKLQKRKRIAAILRNSADVCTSESLVKKLVNENFEEVRIRAALLSARSAANPKGYILELLTRKNIDFPDDLLAQAKQQIKSAMLPGKFADLVTSVAEKI